MMNVDYLQLIDKLKDDVYKNKSFLHLTPNENILSETARRFYSDQISDRYYFGKASNGKNVDLYGFTALGYANIDLLVENAERVFAKRFSAAGANLSPISGIHAMMCVLASATVAGDTVLTLGSHVGGHYATQHILQLFGRKALDIPHDYENGGIDFSKTAALLKTSGSKAIYLDPAYSLGSIDVAKLRSAVGEDILIVYDASHTLGLMMGGVYPNPIVSGADILCANTHKTFPGPHKGVIVYKDKEIQERIDTILKNGMYSSVHTGSLLALAITTLEMDVYGEQYAKQIIANANCLGRHLEDLGLQLSKSTNGSYTSTHQLHLFTKDYGPYEQLYKRFYDSNIAVAFDKPGIFNYGEFIRIGVQEITRRGASEDDMECLARMIQSVLINTVPDDTLVVEFDKFRESLKQKINYSFDQGVCL
jgi:glycine/serine hydroxymethyltransferase